jgi:hypothetical protein
LMTDPTAVQDPHLIRGRKEPAACAAFQLDAMRVQLVHPPPERGRMGGVARVTNL